MRKSYITWIIVHSVILTAIIAFLVIKNQENHPSAYVVNQEIFAGFEAREALNEKLEYVRLRHKQVLDSLYGEITGGQDSETMRSFSELSQQFMEEEQALSDRYTQQVWKQINTYVNAYGEEKNYEMIFGADGSGSLMYAREGGNITNEVLEYINRRYAGEQ